MIDSATPREPAWLLLLAAFWTLAAEPAGAAPFFIGLGDLPGGEVGSGATAVSPDGRTVVGWSFSGNGQEAFRWTPGSGLEPLGDLEGGPFHSTATGVDRSGAFVAGGGTDDGFSPRAFRWTPSQGMQSLGPATLGASSVSADGATVVGLGFNGSGDQEAMRWTPLTGAHTLGKLRDNQVSSNAFGVSGEGSVIVGTASLGAGEREAFYWTVTTGLVGLAVEMPLGVEDSRSWAVSEDGTTIVGSATFEQVPPAELHREAFRRTGVDGVELLGDLPGGETQSQAFAVSADGSVIGGSGQTDEGTRAFIWDAVNGMRQVEVVLAGLGAETSGWALLSVAGLSADGRILVGVGNNPSGNPEAWIAGLPEPAPLYLLGLGFSLIAVLNGRERASARSAASRWHGSVLD